MDECEVCGDPLADGHTHVAVVIREGAALRTAEELLLQFLTDSAELSHDADLTRIAAEAWRDHEANLVGEAEALDDACFQAEAILGGQSFAVVWNDGYIIYDDLKVIPGAAGTTPG
jgi:hypothetical protein